MTMGRFEVGKNGNPHVHGISLGEGSPVVGTIVVDDVNVDGTRDAAAQDMEGDDAGVADDEGDGGSEESDVEDLGEVPEDVCRRGAEFVPEAFGPQGGSVDGGCRLQRRRRRRTRGRCH